MKFSELAVYFEKIESTTSRLEMTQYLAELFSKTDREEIDKVVYLCQGQLVPSFKGIDLGVGEGLLIRAISHATGYDTTTVEKVYTKTGDLGLTAEELVKKKKQITLYTKELTVTQVYDRFYKIATISGKGSIDLKIKYMAELFTSASPLEARYIARFLTGRLRLGIGDPTIIDALSTYKTGSKELREVIERAFNLCSDLGLVARLLVEDIKKIERFKPTVFSPIRPALAERLPSAEAIFERLGECLVDSKYDGMRCQVHKKGEKIELYSRNLERITHMFPDIVEGVKKIPQEEIIFEGEMLAYDENHRRYYSFQETMRRKRKYEIKKMEEVLPLRLFAFDLLYLNGTDYTVKPMKERRKTLEKVIPKDNDRIKVSNCIIAKSAKEIQDFFNECINQHLEGIIAKDLNAPYIAGARKFAWIKLKKSYGKLGDTFDVVIIGYYHGKGHRAKYDFGGLLTAVYNPERDVYETIAKVGSGFSEDMMKQLKEMLDKIKVKHKPKEVDSRIEPDYWVELKYVITVSADEITLSPVHTCGHTDNPEDKGFALRFPRMIQLRTDKNPEDATTTKEIKEMFELQRG